MRNRLLIDGRIFSLQKKGGVSVLWIRIIKSLIQSRLFELAICLYPGSNNNMHLVQSGILESSDVIIIPVDQPPSDNKNFSSDSHYAQIGQACHAIFGRPALVLNTYYGKSIYPGVGQLVVFHDMAHEELDSLRNKESTPHVISLKKQAFDDAACIIAISMATRDALNKHYNNDRSKLVRVVYHGHDPVPPSTKKREIVYVGTRGGYKRFDVLVNAAKSALVGSEWNLTVVGGEAPDPLIDDARLHLGDNFTFIENPTDHEINCTIASAYGYVSTSNYEGFGLPLLQSIASNTIPFISDIPIYKELARDVGVFHKINDSDSLAMTLKSHIQSEKTNVEFGVERLWDEVANEYLDLIQDHCTWSNPNE